jgi:hypothetical protein
MSFHAKRSPSQAKRFMTCPGTFAICETVPDMHRNLSSNAARLGTATHGLVERCLTEGSNPADYEDRIIELIGDEETVSILRKGAKVPGPGRVFFIVDDDMISAAEFCTTYVRERCKELGVDEKSLELESRTNPLPERDPDETSGTADITIPAWPVLLEVVDYKNGYLTVEHISNPQLMAYLLGKALESDWSYEEYQITVVQPNAGHAEGRIRPFKATKKELLAFQKEYRAAIEKCEEAEAAFTGEVTDDWAQQYLEPGDHCTFCDAQPICPARRALAQMAAGVDFDDEPRELEVPDNIEAVTAVLRWRDSIESLIRACDGWLQRHMENGFEAPGFKMVRGKSTRILVDMPESKLVAAILKGKFVTDKAKLYTKPALLSGPQIEKLVPRKRREEFNEKFLVKPEGRLIVVPEDDPRERVDRSAGDDFADDAGDEFDFG